MGDIAGELTLIAEELAPHPRYTPVSAIAALQLGLLCPAQHMLCCRRCTTLSRRRCRRYSPPANVAVDALPQLRYLARGTFGSVLLAEDRECGVLVALKLLQRSQVRGRQLQPGRRPLLAVGSISSALQVRCSACSGMLHAGCRCRVGALPPG